MTKIIDKTPITNHFKTTVGYYVGDKFKLHNTDGPSYIEKNMKGNFIIQKWHIDNKLHRENEPAYIVYWKNKSNLKKCEEYYLNGKLNNPNGPSRIYYSMKSDIALQENYIINRMRHRDGDKPAVIQRNENGVIILEQYYENGILHRVGKPASIIYFPDGKLEQEHYYELGNFIKHNRTQIHYFQDGTIQKEVWHNKLDGPSIIEYLPGGKIKSNTYIYKNKIYSKSDFFKIPEVMIKNNHLEIFE